MLTNFPNGITSFGVVTVGGGLVPALAGRADYIHVDADADFPGTGTVDNPYSTIQAAINSFQDKSPRRNTVILISPREDGAVYDESITITRENAGVNANSGANLYLVGLGTVGSVVIRPSTAGAEAMEVREDDVTLINLIIAGDDTGDYALRAFGARLKAYGCRFEAGEGTGDIVRVGPGTAAQINTDFTHGDGSDCLFYDCEFAWGGNGVVVTSSTYGSCTQLRVEKCRFRNLSGDAFDENDAGLTGSGRNIQVINCVFDNQEGGAEPDRYLDMDSANYSGLVAGCYFATDVLDTADFALATNVKIVDWHCEAEGAPATGGTAGRPD